MLLDGPVDTGRRDQLAEPSCWRRCARRSATSPATRVRRTVDVEVAVGDDVCLRVIDDGVGPPEPGATVGNGLRNMATRAEKLGGSFSLRPNAPSGTMLEWRVALS